MMHPKGDNNWLNENVEYGASSALAKTNYRQAFQLNNYIMQNRNQTSLKNEQYSNYYNHIMSTQNNTAYSNNYSNYTNYSNYSNYSYVNNQQGMQTSQPVWGPSQNPYCLGSSCANHSHPSNAAPINPMQYSHSSYETSSVSHNMGQVENPVMDSLNRMSNYAPHYNQLSNYENPHLSDSKIIENNKRFMSETSKIQVRNVFQLNNAVCGQADTNTPQISNKPGEMNCFLNCLPGQNQNQIIPPIKQHENILSVHGNCNHMKPNQHEGMKSVTKMCQSMPNINSVNMNINNRFFGQNDAPNSLNVTQQFSHRTNVVESIARERNIFPENINSKSAYRKKLSSMQEAVNSEKKKKALAFAIEKANTQESSVTGTGIPKKSPSALKSMKDLTDGKREESAFFNKKSGSKAKTLKKALLGKKTVVEELQNGSKSQRVDEAEKITPEVITIKEEKEDWDSENSYTVETCVIENDTINKNKDEDLYVIKSKFENKIDKDKLTSLMGFLCHESFSNKRSIIIQNAEKNCSSTLESVQFESNNNNKRKLDENILNHDRKKLSKKSSSEMIALSKSIDAEDIESLKSIVLKECGLEQELDFRAEESEQSLKDADKNEEEESGNIERDNTDGNSKIVEKESNPSPKEVIGKEVIEKNTKKRRPLKRSSTDSVDGKSHVSAESVDKNETKDAGVQTVSDPETCPVCLSKIDKTMSEELETIIKTVKAFQSLKHYKCMNCVVTLASNTFWLNVISGELRCLLCFTKAQKQSGNE